MRNYFSVLLVAILCTLASCVDEPPGEYVLTEADLIGTWDVSDFSGSFSVDGTFSGSPIDERGSSRIGDSDLRVALEEDGTWTSSGIYTMTVETETERQEYSENGIGAGTWSFRNGALYLSGLRNTNGNGYFNDPQPCYVLDFVQRRQVGLATEMDVTEADADHDIRLRTRGEFVIQLVR